MSDVEYEMVEVYDDQTCEPIQLRGLRKPTPEQMRQWLENARRVEESKTHNQ